MSDANDLGTFLDLAWQRLGRGVADHRAAARHLTFATVSPEGQPEARTVVLRFVDRDAAVLEVQTDIVTPKVSSLRSNPRAAIHIWDARSRLQIRASVAVEILTGPEVADRWAVVPQEARVSYGTAPDPGTPIDHVYAYKKPARQDRFAVLLCHIQHLDLVELHERHRRAEYAREDCWKGQWLAP